MHEGSNKSEFISRSERRILCLVRRGIDFPLFIACENLAKFGGSHLRVLHRIMLEACVRIGLETKNQLL